MLHSGLQGRHHRMTAWTPPSHCTYFSLQRPPYSPRPYDPSLTLSPFLPRLDPDTALAKSFTIIQRALPSSFFLCFHHKHWTLIQTTICPLPSHTVVMEHSRIKTKTPSGRMAQKLTHNTRRLMKVSHTVFKRTLVNFLTHSSKHLA